MIDRSINRAEMSIESSVEIRLEIRGFAFAKTVE